MNWTLLQNIFVKGKSVYIRKFGCSARNMAKSRFEYVRAFETEDKLYPRHWIVISLNCLQYKKLFEVHDLLQPNDINLTDVFEASASDVMNDFKEISLCYGYKGQFNFVFPKNTGLYKRRGSKLLTNVCSLMSSSFISNWCDYVKPSALEFGPTFEGRVHLFPNDQVLRDYLTQSQYQCHKDNLFRTTQWALINETEISSDEALQILKGTSEGEKNEILFSKCNINYNKEPEVFKKGTVLVRAPCQVDVKAPNGSIVKRNQSKVTKIQTDFVKNDFWSEVLQLSGTLVNSKFNYLKDMETKTNLLPHCWIIVRIDGKGFHKFSEKHNFKKPNDFRSIELMNISAKAVMMVYPDIVLSYGQSDEYSFVIDRYSKMLERHDYKIMSNIVSIFASTYTYSWSKLFPDQSLQYSPAFDGRTVLYPNNSCLRDYLSWRQADCHINNMYNTIFWTLVQKGNCSRQEAEERLRGTFSKDKRSLLLKYNCEYDDEPEILRKGTTIFRTNNSTSNTHTLTESINVCHNDIIGEEFWKERPWILGEEKGARKLIDLDE